MLTVNMHEAKSRLSELVARAIKGEPFVIANRGKPLVKVEALGEAEAAMPRPIGFAKGQWILPDGPGFPEDLPPDEQAEMERLIHDSPIFPDVRRDEEAA